MSEMTWRMAAFCDPPPVTRILVFESERKASKNVERKGAKRN
jgi:hypothetical protein